MKSKISVWKIEYGCEHKKGDLQDLPKENYNDYILDRKDALLTPKLAQKTTNETHAWFDGLHACSNKKHRRKTMKKWCSDYMDDLYFAAGFSVSLKTLVFAKVNELNSYISALWNL